MVTVRSCLLCAIFFLASAEAISADLTEREFSPDAHPATYSDKSQRGEVQLFPRSHPGAELDSKKLIVLEKIGKPPGDPVTLPDVHAANRWLCEAAGGLLDDEYRCSKKRVYRFESKDSLHDLRAHRNAMRSVFRTPGVRSISGPRGMYEKQAYRPHSLIAREIRLQTCGD